MLKNPWLRGFCCLSLFFSLGAFALKCPVLAKGQKPKTLYEKYCDPTENNQQKEQSSVEKEQDSRVKRQEGFLGARVDSKAKVLQPPKTSSPGYSLPKPFVPPTQTENGTWDYLK